MNIPSIDELKLLHSNICQALGDPKRIQILYALHDESRHVSALACALDTPQPTISRHLRVLRQRSMVKTKRNGTAVIYSLATPQIICILDEMRDMLRKTLAQQANILQVAER